jgi:hypothetical protein
VFNVKDVHELFKEAYEEANLEENSQYSNYPREELVIEAEYLYQTLVNIIEYLDQGGTNIDVIRSEVMDGLYESRI